MTKAQKRRRAAMPTVAGRPPSSPARQPASPLRAKPSPGTQPGSRAGGDRSGTQRADLPGAARPGRRLLTPTGGAFLLFAVLVAGLYGRTATFEFTRTDDKVLLLDSARFIEDLANVPKAFTRTFFVQATRGEGYYRPLTTITHILDAQWRGVVPAPFHITNALVHLVAACLLFVFLRRLALGFNVALFGAAIFAVHPALVSAVAWIPGRGDMLLGIGFLVSALAYLRYRETGSPAALAGHLAGLLFALFSKEAGVVLPLLFIGYDLVVERDRRALARPWLWIGWGLALAVWAALWLSAGGMSSGEPLAQRLAVAAARPHVLLMHLGKAVVPVKLSVLAVIQDTPWIPGAVVLLASLGALVWLSARPRRLFGWGLGVFVVFLLPTLPVSDFLILEPRLYAATMGLIVSAGIGIAQVAARCPAVAGWPRAGVAGVALILLASLAAFRYGGSFRNPDTYTRAAVAASPHSALAHLNRGIVLHLEGRLEEAEREYDEARHLNPDQPVLNNNIGVLLLGRGEFARAEQAFRDELRSNPTYGTAHYNLGLVMRNTGRTDEAAAAWRRAVELNPDHVESLQELYRYHQTRGEGVEAERYRSALARLGATAMDTPAASGAGASSDTPQAPGGATEIPLDRIPRETLINLYRQALERDPTNQAIRQKYEELLRQDPARGSKQ